MNSSKAKSTFHEASQFLDLAKKELIRSEEDVVPQMVCSGSRKAILGFLQSFLLKKGVNNPSNSLDELLKECKKLSPKFKQYDLQKMKCRMVENEDNYCSDLSSANICFSLATEAKKIVANTDIKIWPKSKAIK